MKSKQKLELTWIGKENRTKLEPRILLEDLENSYHAKYRVNGKDIFDNHKGKHGTFGKDKGQGTLGEGTFGKGKSKGKDKGHGTFGKDKGHGTFGKG